MTKVTEEELKTLSKENLVAQYLALQSEYEVIEAKHVFLGKMFVHNTRQLVEYQQQQIAQLNAFEYEQPN